MHMGPANCKSGIYDNRKVGTNESASAKMPPAVVVRIEQLINPRHPICAPRSAILEIKLPVRKRTTLDEFALTY